MRGDLLKLKTDKQNGIYLDANTYNKHIEHIHFLNKSINNSTPFELAKFIKENEILFEDIVNGNFSEVLNEGSLKIEDIIILIKNFNK